MPIPDFVKMKCRNTDLPNCFICNKEFVVPVSSIEMICKDGAKALILIKTSEYYPDPSCPMLGTNRRFIETESDWESILSLLDGSVKDLGDIKLKEFPNVAFVK